MKRGAVTFDFWDTIVADDSDEPKRAARGLPPKAEARLVLVRDEIAHHHPSIAVAAIDAAYSHMNARFRHWWKVERRTPPIADRLDEAFRHLGIDRTPGFDALAHAIGRMEVDVPPDLAPGIVTALDGLAGRYALGIISDTIVTPGWGLREILRGYGLDHRFATPIFSDEAGAAKPSAKVFQAAARGLDVTPDRLVHIGDREETDVEGAIGAGARAVLYTGVVDRGSAATRAHAVCRDLRDLPRIVEELLGGRE